MVSLSFYDCNASLIAPVSWLNTSFSLFWVCCSFDSSRLSICSICSMCFYLLSTSATSPIIFCWFCICMVLIISSLCFSTFSLTNCSYVLTSSFLSLFCHTCYWCSCCFRSRMTCFYSLTSYASSLTCSFRCTCRFSWSNLACKRAYSTTICLFFFKISFSLSTSSCSRCFCSLNFFVSRICSALRRVWSIFLSMRASSFCKRLIRFCSNFSSWSY